MEKEIAQDEEMKGEDNLDETVFDKFATGELDLPDLDDEESSDDGAADVGADDSELEAYYEELGIDPAEMIDKSKPGAEEKPNGGGAGSTPKRDDKSDNESQAKGAGVEASKQ